MDAARNVARPCSRSVTGRRRFIMTLVSALDAGPMAAIMAAGPPEPPGLRFFAKA